MTSIPVKDDITPIQPKEAGPNLWTVLQKWILALPVDTEEQRERRRGLQKELERTAAELDDGSGIGEGGVCQREFSESHANILDSSSSPTATC
jgi:ethanolamine kinase